MGYYVLFQLDIACLQGFGDIGRIRCRPERRTMSISAKGRLPSASQSQGGAFSLANGGKWTEKHQRGKKPERTVPEGEEKRDVILEASPELALQFCGVRRVVLLQLQ